MTPVTDHQNSDILGLGVCFALGAFALSGSVAICTQPAVQTFLEDSASYLAHHVIGMPANLSTAR